MKQTDTNLRHELEARLRFERILAEISAQFINLPADRIDGAIGSAQRRICRFLGLDRSTLFQVVEEESGTLLLSHIHQPPGSLSPPEWMNAEKFFPWSVRKVLGGETLAISKMSDLPPEAGRDRETFGRYGTRSTVIVPLSVGNRKVFGVLSFAVIREERDWPEAAVKQFEMIAQIFANALSRKRADLDLRESETRLSLATNAAGAGMWSMEVGTGKVWGTAKVREIFHFSPDEPLTYERFFEVIHPEDQGAVRQVVKQAIRSGEVLQSEFRIVPPGGGIRWIAARGQRYLRTAGAPGRLMGVSIDVTTIKEMEIRLRKELKEIERLKRQLEQENLYLRDEIMLQHGHKEIVGRSAAMTRVLAQVEQVAATDATVLIQGETGAGKELLARAVHGLSRRKDRPLITINCSALPPTLIESELFGREKGAYTGAMTRMAGRFELADRSTLFLDEIGELPPDLQAKLLRVLEEGRFERLGSAKSLQVNVRIIAATNRNLSEEVAAGRFRSDMYFRLNVFPILIPPLRERSEDIPPLVWAFVRQYEKKMGKPITRISRRGMAAMQRYTWPGNVRELKNIVEYAMITSSGGDLHIRLPEPASGENFANDTLESVERRHILGVLAKTGWRVTGKGGAAEILGMKRTTLQSRMKKLGIVRPDDADMTS